MQTQTTPIPRKKRSRASKIIINSDHLAKIEALAESAMKRNPALAQQLLDDLGRARIVKAAKMPATTASIGSTVTYLDEDTGQQKTIVLVFPSDADIDQQKVSVLAPIGAALLGHSEGACFSWNTRDDQYRRLKVLSVSQPDKQPNENI